MLSRRTHDHREPRSVQHLRSGATIVTGVLAAAVLMSGLALAASPTPTPSSSQGGSASASPSSRSASASVAVPPTPSGLTSAIEVAQPYIGQSTCDPVAKPGVKAFRDLLLTTYPDTGSLGIVLDCGAAGQSEHKEGRAFDWAVSVNNPQQVAEVKALMGWLLATDSDGHPYAMAKRLGLMYMIWDHQMWRAYGNSAHVANRWDPYDGASAHTDHVHFSFGWNGARQATSYWTGGVVAPVYTGARDLPSDKPSPTPTPAPTGAPTNSAVLRSYGQLTLKQGDSGPAVKAMQRGLKITADGGFGPQTGQAVSAFQRQQKLPVSGRWGPAEWSALFPVPATRPVTISGDAVQNPLYAGTFVITGTAEANARVDLHFHKPGTPAADYSTVRSVTADSKGNWSRSILATTDYRYYASAGTRTTGVILNQPVPLVDGPLSRTVTKGDWCAVTGRAPAGSVVYLLLHRAGTAPGDFSIVRTATAGSNGGWRFSYRADDDYRFFVARTAEAAYRDGANWLVQAR